ncbi:lipoprotein [Betaproteobacteria bacterium]|nr:lipoprotein [Betaproteobacteria bacterium]GHU45909.1 lipoprotein [Betaproteobacteria bacterium]
MKKNLAIASLLFASLFLSACDPQPAETGSAQTSLPTDPVIEDTLHTSENSLSWAGVYEGTTPGANSDIHIQMTLGYDKTYAITYQYLDKSDEKFTEHGTFRWNEGGNTIILDSADLPSQYRVGEGFLTQLDMSGKVITGEHADRYVLKQIIVNDSVGDASQAGN